MKKCKAKKLLRSGVKTGVKAGDLALTWAAGVLIGIGIVYNAIFVYDRLNRRDAQAKDD